MQTILGGGGAIGRILAKELLPYTNPVRIFGRSPKNINGNDELIAGDLTSMSDVSKAIKGSDIVYLVAGLPYKLKVWQREWPLIMQNVIEGCKLHQTKLVFFDNIYMYDQSAVTHLTEDSAINPPSKKGKVRAAIAQQILDEINSGTLTAVILRAADFYGPNVATSVLNETVYKNLKQNKPAFWIGDKNKIHSYTYTPDAAKATALLANTRTHLLFAQAYKNTDPFAHTFSIVARDSVTGEMGVAVQSHWFSVGTVVSWAEAGVGAVATQSFVNKSFGVRGLNLLRRGLTAQQALDSLLATDEGREVRQVGIVDSKGNVATHTGNKCIDYAGHIKGNGFSVQANMMLTDKVPSAMERSYSKSKGKPLAERLLMALESAESAGGDIRGKQSAAIIIVPGKSNNEPWNERIVDLRVDDSNEPIKEIRRLYNVHVAYEHMNNGDLAIEKNDMPKAMQEYNAAMKMFPSNLEMQYWTAITLANNKQLDKALPILEKVFSADANWKELTKRLPKVNLLTVSEEELKRIMRL